MSNATQLGTSGVFIVTATTINPAAAILNGNFTAIVNAQTALQTSAASAAAGITAANAAIVTLQTTTGTLSANVASINSTISGLVTPTQLANTITALNLGTAATHAAGDFATPAAVAGSIAALALGSASTHAAGDFAPALHTHDAGDIVTGTFAQARIPAQPWSSITGKPAFAAVATSGSAADLSGTLNVAQLPASVPIMAGGKISAANLPALAVVDFLGYPASQAAMLALVGQRGDWAIRTDTAGGNTTWRLIGDDATQLANWVQEANPGSVTSVNGMTGPVTLASGNIAESGNLYFTNARADARVQAGITALNLGTASTHAAGDFATPANLTAAIAAQGLGTAATHAAGDFAAAAHTHDAAAVTTGVFAAARIPAQPWSSITGKPTFATIATSGNAGDLVAGGTLPALIGTNLNFQYVQIRTGDSISDGDIVALRVGQDEDYNQNGQAVTLRWSGDYGRWQLDDDDGNFYGLACGYLQAYALGGPNGGTLPVYTPMVIYNTLTTTGEITINYPQTSLVPTMSGYTASGVTVSASNEAANPCWSIFGYNYPSQFWGTDSGSIPAWVRVDFSTPKTVTQYQFRSWEYGTGGVYAWQFQGSNDGTTWTTLDSGSGRPYPWDQAHLQTLSAPATYAKFRLYITAATDGGGTYPGASVCYMRQFLLFTGGSRTIYSTLGNLLGAQTITPFTNQANAFSGGLQSFPLGLAVTAAAPSSATAAGAVGEIRSDASYIYACTAANTWKRAALATW